MKSILAFCVVLALHGVFGIAGNAAADAAEQGAAPEELSGLVTEARFRPFPTLDPPRFACQELPAPVLDGALADSVWQDPAAEVGVLVDDRDSRAPEVKTTVYMTRRGRTLYVGFRCEDPGVNLRSPFLRLDRARWPSEGAYVLIGAENGETLSFAIDPTGLQYDSQAGADPGVRRGWSAATRMTEDGWTAEMAIPYQEVGLDAVDEGTTLAVNFLRKRARNGLLAAWAPTGGELRRTESFGRVSFGPPLPAPRGPGVDARMDRRVYPADAPLARLAVRLHGGRRAWRNETLTVSVRPPRPRPGEEVPDLPEDATLRPTGELGEMLVDLSDVPPGEHTLTLFLGRDRRNPLATGRVLFTKTDEKAEPQAGEIVFTTPPGEPSDGWPMRAGAAFPRGALASVENLRLVDEGGGDVPFQATPLTRWSARGPIQWAAIGFDASIKPDAPTRYTLRYGPEVRPPTRDRARMTHRFVGDTIVVDTGTILFNVRRTGFVGISEAWIDETGQSAYTDENQVIWARDETSGPYLVDENGRRYLASLYPHTRVRVEEAGRRRYSLRAEGWFAAEPRPDRDDELVRPGPPKLGRFVTRFIVYAGKPFLRVQHTFILTHDTSDTRLRELGFAVQADAYTERMRADFGVDGETRSVDLSDAPARVAQMAAGRCVFTGSDEAGQRADGWLTLRSQETFRRDRVRHKGLTVVVRDMAETFPADIEAGPDGTVTVRAWPSQWDEEDTVAPTRPGLARLGALETFHTGPTLDLAPPASAYRHAHDNLEDHPDQAAVAAALETNGMGVALTLDMVYYLRAAPPDPESVGRMVRLCAEWPRAAADPAALAKATALRYAPLGEEASRRVARVRDTVWEGLMEREERDPQPGKFNRLDFRRNWLDEDRWGLDRHWVGNSHGVPALLWRLFAESGEARFALAAERNTLHIIDRAMCHYATPEMARAERVVARKRRGGFAEPATFIHWHAANGIATPWSRADFLARAMLLSGSLRARDALDEWTAAFREDLAAPSGDGALAALAGLAPAYAMTGDGFLLFRLRRLFDRVVNSPAADFDPQHYASAVAAHREVGDPREVRAFMSRLADRMAGSEDSAENLNDLGIYMDAYEITGSGRYLTLARRIVDRYVDDPDALRNLGWAEAAALLEYYPLVLAAQER